jgi:hypothetical protein
MLSNAPLDYSTSRPPKLLGNALAALGDQRRLQRFNGDIAFSRVAAQRTVCLERDEQPDVFSGCRTNVFRCMA